MPKRVDHGQRRRELAEALVRCARTRPLHAIGYREVAAEAGVSTNLVQYYFPTKEQLLHGGLAHLRAVLAQRLRDRLPGSAGDDDPVRRIRLVLRELLPLDPVSADLYRVHAAYAALALTDPALAARPHTAGPDEIHPELTALLTAALPPHVDPHLAAAALLGAVTGLSAYTASGYLTGEQAARALDQHLDLVLAARRPG
ncbi:TetR/AcrR family transcriptional regulator [Saccharothrix algeriensis]|uniref:AcrR family transcriptional regulator n=1 Tax=Saccharothrix algeriensis TaxID=173560 RepID=A0A8T8HWU9_9PSEU|nr:TetR/AcrR family transcriptional regulator [Saccharothrix algeriensis]MBM7814796.1 AcrR family transcriptional regulator [Saccharothrix algeriensis]QTR03065.1 TetR family transcriptional regulator C-terminal domain-containing protein [Saccharothrix algeriensis]